MHDWHAQIKETVIMKMYSNVILSSPELVASFRNYKEWWTCRSHYTLQHQFVIVEEGKLITAILLLSWPLVNLQTFSVELSFKLLMLNFYFFIFVRVLNSRWCNMLLSLQTVRSCQERSFCRWVRNFSQAP